MRERKLGGESGGSKGGGVRGSSGRGQVCDDDRGRSVAPESDVLTTSYHLAEDGLSGTEQVAGRQERCQFDRARVRMLCNKAFGTFPLVLSLPLPLPPQPPHTHPAITARPHMTLGLL